MPGTLLTRDGEGPASLPLRMLAGPYQHFKSAGVLAAWKEYRCGPLLDYEGTKQLLFSSHLRERNKMLLRSILCGGTWNGLLLGKSRRRMFRATSAGVLMEMVFLGGLPISLRRADPGAS